MTEGGPCAKKHAGDKKLTAEKKKILKDKKRVLKRLWTMKGVVYWHFNCVSIKFFLEQLEYSFLYSHHITNVYLCMYLYIFNESVTIYWLVAINNITNRIYISVFMFTCCMNMIWVHTTYIYITLRIILLGCDNKLVDVVNCILWKFLLSLWNWSVGVILTCVSKHNLS